MRSGLTACSHPAIAADAIFVNGFVWALNESMPTARAVTIDGNEIVYVGDSHGEVALRAD